MPNLKPLTVAQELRLQNLKADFAEHLTRVVTEALRNAKDGRVWVPFREIASFLDRAYLLGREDS
jgi:phenylpyruvate tautomerase PptA (4-oxalocrotonate tautomerase family)